MKLFFMFLIFLSCFTTIFAETRTNSTEINLLVYNTHGLHAFFSRDYPSKRFPQIGKLTEGYELLLFQEDFSYHQTLLESLAEKSIIFRSDDTRSLPCFFCQGSGLTIISNFEADWHLKNKEEAFKTCSGWLRGLNDCFASKGFQLLLLESSNGKRFFVLNTHLDAGRDTLDREARADQLQQILTTIQKETGGEALIIAGDLNLDWEDQEDRSLLKEFMNDLGLINPGKRIQAERGWPILDYILYRNGNSTTLEVLEIGEDIAFQNDEVPLSDHPALFMKFLLY